MSQDEGKDGSKSDDWSGMVGESSFMNAAAKDGSLFPGIQYLVLRCL